MVAIKAVGNQPVRVSQRAEQQILNRFAPDAIRLQHSLRLFEGVNAYQRKLRPARKFSNRYWIDFV